MKRKLITILIIGLIATSAIAQSKVFITEHGKSYHLYKNCRALVRSSNIKEVDLKDVNGRELCKICQYRSKGK